MEFTQLHAFHAKGRRVFRKCLLITLKRLDALNKFKRFPEAKKTPAFAIGCSSSCQKCNSIQIF